MAFGINPLVGGLSFGGGMDVWDTMNLGAQATGTPGYGFSLMPSGGMAFPTYGFGAPRTSYWGSSDFRGVADIAIGSNDLQRGTYGLGGFGGYGGFGSPMMGAFNMAYPFSNLGPMMAQLAENLAPASFPTYAAGPANAVTPSAPPPLASEPATQNPAPDVEKDASASPASTTGTSAASGTPAAGHRVDEAKVRRDFNVPGVNVLGVTDDGRVRIKPDASYDPAASRRELASSLRKLKRDGVKDVIVGDTGTTAIPVQARTGSRSVPVMETKPDGTKVPKMDAAGRPVTRRVPSYGPNTRAVSDALNAAKPSAAPASSPSSGTSVPPRAAAGAGSGTAGGPPPAAPVVPPPVPAPTPPAGSRAAGAAPAPSRAASRGAVPAPFVRNAAAAAADRSRADEVMYQAWMSRAVARANLKGSGDAHIERRGNRNILSIRVKDFASGFALVRALSERPPANKPVAIELVAQNPDANSAAQNIAGIVNERIAKGNTPWNAGSTILVVKRDS
ncbi:MAG: hypothetical protein COV45_09080 [Deltaproteobacteria bacterium CG11_big_fil_rev_8_21_14_0_20_47_16]|nr:MAG: hypothetical protein COV45_09080 [Deltaproteobacteria bacterium CG11_big_fil_rev_8_21_14_0_20_47_16]